MKYRLQFSAPLSLGKVAAAIDTERHLNVSVLMSNSEPTAIGADGRAHVLRKNAANEIVAIEGAGRLGINLWKFLEEIGVEYNFVRTDNPDTTESAISWGEIEKKYGLENRQLRSSGHRVSYRDSKASLPPLSKTQEDVLRCIQIHSGNSGGWMDIDFLKPIFKKHLNATLRVLVRKGYAQVDDGSVRVFEFDEE